MVQCTAMGCCQHSALLAEVLNEVKNTVYIMQSPFTGETQWNLSPIHFEHQSCWAHQELNSFRLRATVKIP